jgi:hypothetical protein
MHIHVGALDFFITAAYIIIFAYIWRAISSYWADRPIGQAMAFIF